MKRSLLVFYQFIVFAMFVSFTVVNAQTPFTAVYTFGSDGNVASFAYNGTTYDGVTLGNALKVGVTTASSSNNFRATLWPTGATDGSNTFTGSVDLQKYIQFSIESTTGYKYTVNTINFGVGRSATGPRQWQIRGSLNSYASPINNYTNLASGLTNNNGVLTNTDTNSSWVGNVLNIQSLYENLTEESVFRIYGYNSEAGTGTAGLQGVLTITGTFELEASGDTPTIIISPTSITDFNDITVGQNSDSQFFTVSGLSLTTGVTITAPTNFQVSTDDVNFSSGFTLDQSGGTLMDQPVTVYVRFAPSSAGLKEGFITLNSAEAEEKTISVSGTGVAPIIGAPVATAATAITTSSFQANWNGVQGATNYRLDVYTQSVSSASATEGFETGMTMSSYATGNGVFSLATGDWTFVNVIRSTSTANNFNNSASGCQMQGATGSTAITPTFTGISTLKFHAKRGGSSGSNLTVYKIVNDVETELQVVALTTTVTQYTINVNESNSNEVRIKFVNGSQVGYLDNVIVDYSESTITYVEDFFNRLVAGTSELVTGVTPGTSYNYVVRAFDGTTSENSNTISVTTAVAPATFGSIVQAASVCDGTTATFNVSGLLPQETTTLTYQVVGSDPVSVNLSTGPGGTASFQLPLAFSLNGVNLTVLSVARNGLEGSTTVVTENNVVVLAVTAQPTWYLDADLDGYYTGEPVVSCDSPGAGYTTTVLPGGDCDDTNVLVNPGATEVCFDGVDSNCSGNDSDSCPVVVNITTFCGSTLPIINSTIKCSVPNLSFYGSGFTLGYRFRVTNTSTNAVAELDLSVPNFKLTMTDIYSYNTVFTIEVAAIVNGHVQSYLGTPCTITTPDIPLNQVGSITCGTTLPELNSRIVATNVFGSIHYRFRVALSDAPTTYEYVISPTASMRLNRLVDLPMNFGKTYLISVQSLIEVDGVETYSDFGSECAVITPSVSTISVSPVECGQTLGESNSRIYINSVPNATLYRYRVALASNPSVTEDITSPFTSFRLTGLTGVVPLLYASDYLVSVQVEVTIDGQVFLSPFSDPCTISTPGFPETSIQASQCSNGDEENEAPYEPLSLNEQISATAVSGASYRFLLERYVNNELVYSEELIRSVNWFTLANFNSISPLEPGATYSISVGLNKNGIGPYGKDCSLIVPGVSNFVRMSSDATQETTKVRELFTAVAYPNPFADSFNLDIKANATAPITIVVYDMMGRLLESKNITIDQANTANIGGNYPTGVYNVVVTQGEDVKMVRVVKQ